MKKLLYTIAAFCITGSSMAQMDQEIFLKARMAGTVTMHDSTEISIMYFKENSILGGPNLPSPTLYMTEGDSVKIDLHNLSQGAPHTVHLHGLDVDQQNDGVPHLSFEVWHMEHGQYYFKAPHPGTYIYHCHVVSTVHVQAGMYGMIVVRPSGNQNETWNGGYTFDSEQTWLTSEVDPFWHSEEFINTDHDSTMMQFQLPPLNPEYFLINGLSEGQLVDNSTAINIDKGEVRYMHIAAIGNYMNEIVFPEDLNAKIISSDGRPLDPAIDSDTLRLTPGERYGVLLSPTVDINTNATVSFVDLNTQLVTSTQEIPVLAQWHIGIGENQNWNLSVYPNPSAEIFTISGTSDVSGDLKVELCDVQGRAISPSKYQTSFGDEINLNLGDLPNATYLVKLIRNGKLIHTDWLTKFSN